MSERNLITISDTNFIFKTNFAGDPERDAFGSNARKANIIIPTQEQADALADAGFNVKVTKPRDDEDDADFVPQYYVMARANYETDYPPKIYLVVGDTAPTLLDADSVNLIDKIYVNKVNAVLNPYYSQKNNRWSLYIRTMYVEQNDEDDPFASRYKKTSIEHSNAETMEVSDDDGYLPFN